MCVLLILLQGCITHDTIPLIIKVPKFYPSRFEKDNLFIIADPYAEKSKVRYIFGKDIRKKGIYPIHLIFQNHGTSHFDIASIESFLTDEKGREYTPITLEEASKSILRNTPIRVVAYGLLGSAFLVLTVPFAVSAGVSSYRTNKAIREDFSEKQSVKELIRPHEVSHGFLFFSVSKKQEIVSV